MTTGGVNQIFVDTNVLVYANLSGAPLHQVAIHAIQAQEAAGTQLWISRQVLREYIATVTRPQSYATPLPLSTVISRVQYFEQHFQIAEDSAAVTANLLSLIQQILVGGKQIHDANIVATMQEYGIPDLLTHNAADFARFRAYINVIQL